jgi:iron complex outermembrane receptor protein
MSWNVERLSNKIEYSSAFAAFLLLPSPCLADQAPTKSYDVISGWPDIVVAATMRPQNIIDTPLDITVLDLSDIQKRTGHDLSDLLSAAPNLSSNESGQTQMDPVVRGIASNTRNAGVESGVSIYVDGVYTGRPETFNQTIDDVRSVEVLPGPQGTLVGKNAIAGAIIVRTNDPDFSTSAAATAEFGNLAARRFAATFNLPISRDRAALRITGFDTHRDGYVRNLNGGPDLGSRKEYGGRAKLLLQPSNSISAIVAADYSRERSDYYLGENLAGTSSTEPPPQPVTAPGPFTVDVDPGLFYRQLYGASLTVTARLAGGFELLSITGYRHSRYRLSDDQDWSPKDFIAVDFRDRQSQFSHEVRLKSPDDRPLQYVVGTYYFAQNSHTAHIGYLGADFVIPGVIAPGSRKPATPLGTIETRSIAGFIDGSVRLTSGLDLLFGARLTRETKHVDFQVNTDPSALPLFYAIPPENDQQRQTDFSPNVGVRYRIGERSNVYARISRGYKSGGWNVDFISRNGGAPAPTIQQLRFAPEKLTNYEIGLKGDFFDRRLRASVATYYMQYRNLQVTQFFGFNGGAVTSNAASASIKGLSGELSAIISPRLLIGTAVGFNDARYDRYPDASVDGLSADGKRLAGPRVTAEANATLSIPVATGSLSLWGEVSYRGQSFTEPLNLTRLRLPRRAIANASLSYLPGRSHFTLALWGRNLFNHTYITNILDNSFAFPGTTDEIATYGVPRTYGLKLNVKI